MRSRPPDSSLLQPLRGTVALLSMWLRQQGWRSWHGFLNALGSNVTPRRVKPIRLMLTALTEASRRPTFVEIGANDGVTLNPLAHFVRAGRWSGVRIEPQPRLFKQLQANSAGAEGIVLENAAITECDGDLDFYFLREDFPVAERPEWYSLVGSLSLAMIQQSARLLPGGDSNIVSTKVAGLCFDSLCSRHGVDQFHFLYVDAEGYDYKILKQVDLARYRPKLIVFEHQHLSSEDRQACFSQLREHGYEWIFVWFDALCFRTSGNSLNDRLLRAIWRGVKKSQSNDSKATVAVAGAQ